MKRRGLIILLVVIICMTFISFNASAASTKTIAPKYDKVENFSENLAAVCLNGKWGFVDKSGNVVIPIMYDGAEEFSDGQAWVNLDGKETLIDKTGAEVMPFKYDAVTNLFDGMSMVKLSGKRGFVDKTGKEVIAPVYDNARRFTESMAAVCLNGKWGFIDKNGNTVISFSYDEAYCFSEGLSAVCVDGKWGFIDATGKQVVTLKYDSVGNFSEGMAQVCLDGKWGYVDANGSEIVAPQYDKVGQFSEGLAWVGYTDDGVEDDYLPTWSYIDKTGKQVTATKYYGVTDFSEGLAAVSYADPDCYIDANGNDVLKPYCNFAWFWDNETETLSAFHEGYATVSMYEIQNGVYGLYWGYIDKTGTEVVSRKYTAARDCSEGMAAVELDGKWGFVSLGTASPETVTALVSPQKVTVNGTTVSFDVYNINGNNYFKLRDLAYSLSGTEKQFEVGWDGVNNAISLTSGKAYTVVGGEMTIKGTGNKSGTSTTSSITKDGSPVSFTAYNIEDNNYFKLRDIGAAFNIGVYYDSATNTVVINTGKGYVAE